MRRDLRVVRESGRGLRKCRLASVSQSEVCAISNFGRGLIAAIFAAALGAGIGVAGTNNLRAAYGGLGATRSAFYAQKPHGALPPPLGVAYYTIDRVRAGRVVGFHVTINVRPPLSSRERLGLVSGINLPDDATATTINGNTCIVFQSRKLSILIGMRYAAATARPGATTAQLRGELSPRC